MNKEEKELMRQNIEATKDIVAALKNFTPDRPPVLFSCKCSVCGEITAHVSHIARLSATEQNASFISERPSNGRPIKTCLVCGLNSYRTPHD